MIIKLNYSGGKIEILGDVVDVTSYDKLEKKLTYTVMKSNMHQSHPGAPIVEKNIIYSIEKTDVESVETNIMFYKI